MHYTYDFGDGWEHDIVLEKQLDPDPGEQSPTCLVGKGPCPPEDCGGSWGYADLKESLADPSHEAHEDMLEWLGLENAADFDPSACNVAEINDVLRMTIASRSARASAW
jgi:Plasmid pRiA4b ORF-3-like protein